MKYYDMSRNKFMEEGDEEKERIKEEYERLKPIREKVKNISPINYIKWLATTITTDFTPKNSLEPIRDIETAKKQSAMSQKKAKVFVSMWTEFVTQIQVIEDKSIVESVIEEIINLPNPVGYLMSTCKLPYNPYLLKDMMHACYFSKCLDAYYTYNEMQLINLVAKEMKVSEVEKEKLIKEVNEDYILYRKWIDD